MITLLKSLVLGTAIIVSTMLAPQVSHAMKPDAAIAKTGLLHRVFVLADADDQDSGSNQSDFTETWIPPTIALVLLLLEVFWIVQFVQLMMLEERNFPGRYDKPLWVVAFVFTNVLSAFAFYYWTRVMVATTEIEREEEAPREAP